MELVETAHNRVGRWCCRLSESGDAEVRQDNTNLILDRNI